ncbi:hypothetical protein QCF01_14150 [Staphylococcus aureus]|nr:hypothetical protein [Staphylococcus aureus]
MALACLSAPVVAQTSYPPMREPSTITRPAGAAFVGADGQTYVATPATPLPVAAKQESAALVSANVPAAAVTLYGGSYVLSQLCATYGSVALRYRAADGVTMTPLVTKVAADAVATVVQFGSGVVVDATVSGTTGCNVALSRIP